MSPVASISLCACVLSRFCCVQLFVTPWNLATLPSQQAPLPMEFPRQEFWNGLPFPLPGDLSNPRTEPTSPEAPALQGDFLP